MDVILLAILSQIKTVEEGEEDFEISKMFEVVHLVAMDQALQVFNPYLEVQDYLSLVFSILSIVSIVKINDDYVDQIDKIFHQIVEEVVVINEVVLVNNSFIIVDEAANDRVEHETKQKPFLIED